MSNTHRSFWMRMYALKLHHVLFWLIYMIFWISLYRNMYDSVYYLTFVTSIYALFNGAAFYITAYYLLPKFFYRRKYGRFVLLFVANILLSAAGLAFCLLFLFEGNNIPFQNRFFGLFMMALASSVTIVGVMIAIKLLVDRIKSERMESRLDNQRLASELQYLKAQVNPHFLFNAINSVYFLIKKDPDMASETLIRLSDLLRFQLYDCSEEKIVIEKELEYLQNYISLEKLRKGPKVRVDYSTQGAVSGFQIAPFLLIPFLENAFKFVTPDSGSDASDIRFTVAREDNQFRATFFNVHDGLPRNTVGGIGLKNVRRRLELLYPEKHTLSIDEKATSYAVTLTLDL